MKFGNLRTNYLCTWHMTHKQWHCATRQLWEVQSLYSSARYWCGQEKKFGEKDKNNKKESNQLDKMESSWDRVWRWRKCSRRGGYWGEQYQLHHQLDLELSTQICNLWRNWKLTKKSAKLMKKFCVSPGYQAVKTLNQPKSLKSRNKIQKYQNFQKSH